MVFMSTFPTPRAWWPPQDDRDDQLTSRLCFMFCGEGFRLRVHRLCSLTTPVYRFQSAHLRSFPLAAAHPQGRICPGFTRRREGPVRPAHQCWRDHRPVDGVQGHSHRELSFVRAESRSAFIWAICKTRIHGIVAGLGALKLCHFKWSLDCEREDKTITVDLWYAGGFHAVEIEAKSQQCILVYLREGPVVHWDTLLCADCGWERDSVCVVVFSTSATATM